MVRELEHSRRASTDSDDELAERGGGAKGQAAGPPAFLDLSPRSLVDGLPARGARAAYLWRDGVRWRDRTYAELHQGILACSRFLFESGVRPGSPVLIQGPEHPDTVEALLGTFLAGGVAVPLDVGSSLDFRTKVVHRVGGGVFVGPRKVEPPAGIARLELGSWSARPSDQRGQGRGDEVNFGVIPTGFPDVDPSRASSEPYHDIGPQDRAEIVFTSGTTGEPRGVVLTHGNLAFDLEPILRVYRRYEPRLRPLGALRFLSTLPLSHMFGQAVTVFLALRMGLTVAFVPPRPRDVLLAARRKKAWGLFTVPRVLDLLGSEIRLVLGEEGRLEAYLNRERRFERRPFYVQALAFPRVRRLLGWRFRLLVSGGAPLPEAVQQFWQGMGYLVVQGYGLTETAPIVSISNPFHRGLGDVGRALGNQEVKLGPDGEVLVRGPNVTPGYLGDAPTMNRDGAKAVAEAAERGQNEGWFPTGDVGEIDSSGRLRIRGRLKDVIVTPEGENVHPGDVEAAFRGLPGLREVCVLGTPASTGERVHAVLLLEKGTDAQKVVEAANGRLLARQRVRDHTVWPDDDLPRTPTGKVRKAMVRDRILASQHASAGGQGGAEPVAAAPPGAVRRLIAEVASIRPERLETSTRLVEGLGLGSLDLVELAAAFERELGMLLPEDRLATLSVGDLEALARDSGASRTPAPVTEATVQASPAASPGETPQQPSAAPDREVVADAESSLLPRPGSLRMPRWAYAPLVQFLRRIFERTIEAAIVAFFARPRLSGLEHLTEAEPPYLIVANHRSYLDTGLIKVILGGAARGRIAPAMATRYYRVYFGEIAGSRRRYLAEWIQVFLVQLLSGAWPLPETAGFLTSLAFAGELADEGISLLIFPEGRHVREGMIEAFRKGIGIFARELRTPVVPVYLEGTAIVYPDRAWWPRVHATRLVVGRPIRIDPDADAGEIARLLESAVRELGEVRPRM